MWVQVPAAAMMGQMPCWQGMGAQFPSMAGMAHMPYGQGMGAFPRGSTFDHAGSGMVLVRGFDFGTTDEQLEGHMMAAGPIISIERTDKGSAMIGYMHQASAFQAAEMLDKSVIYGNKRFIDVIVQDSDPYPRPQVPAMTAMTHMPFRQGKGAYPRGGSFDHAGSGKVLVRGFDFGTTDDELEGHMMAAGPIMSIERIENGSAIIVYRRQASAFQAAEILDKSIIYGNKRFIDVIVQDSDPYPRQQVPAMTAMAPAPYRQGMGAFMRQQAPAMAHAPSRQGMGAYPRGNTPDPVGSGRVFVRGFDFGTTDDQLEGHMRTAGPILSIQRIDKGSAIVIYKRMASAVNAAELNKSVIDGNARFIDVILKPSE